MSPTGELRHPYGHLGFIYTYIITFSTGLSRGAATDQEDPDYIDKFRDRDPIGRNVY